MTVPRNVLRFEVLLYLSLALDALSMPFREAMFNSVEAMPESAAKLVTAAMILGFTALVWLAARYRRNWARWVLVVAVVLSAISTVGDITMGGVDVGNAEDLVSAVLSGLGLYYSFTGDARDWFLAGA